MKKIVFYSLLLCCIAACNKAEKLKEDTVFDPRYPETDAVCRQAGVILEKADSVFMRANYLVELYVSYYSENKMIKVDNFDNVEENNLDAFYNLIRYENGEIMYVAEFPYSKSGDWENIYESIFDDKGNLLLFVRKSSFFSKVSENYQAVYEKSEYYYMGNKLLKKTYEITNNNGQPIDIDNIPLLYRYSYEQYKTRKAWLRAHGLEK